MHEMSLVQELLRIIDDVAERERLRDISRVTVAVGEGRQVVDELFRFAFDNAKAAGAARDAVLELEFVPIVAVCNACGGRFRVEEHRYSCPSCGAGETEVVEGEDIVITELEGERKNDDH